MIIMELHYSLNYRGEVSTIKFSPISQRWGAEQKVLIEGSESLELKGQAQRSVRDAHDLQALRKHSPKTRHESVLGITAWTAPDKTSRHHCL